MLSITWSNSSSAPSPPSLCYAFELRKTSYNLIRLFFVISQIYIFLILFHIYFSEVCIINRLKAELPRSRSSISCGRKIFLKLVWTRSGAKLLISLLVTRVDVPVCKNMGHEFNNRFTHSDEAKNEMFYTFILPHFSIT